MPSNNRSPEQHLDDILSLSLEDCAVTVCLGSVCAIEEEPKIEQLQLSTELAGDFRGTVSKSVLKCSERKVENDLVLRAYDAGSKPDPHEIEYVSLAEHESIEKQVESLASLAKIPLFRLDEAFIRCLRFYAIVLQPKQGKPLFCFRTYTPKKELSRSTRFAAIFAEGAFDRIRQPVFLFDQSIDCMNRDGMMFIFSKHNFERIFRFFELVLETAEQTLKAIEAHVPIANFDEFKHSCDGHLQMQAKLKNIANKPYLSKVTMSDIKRVLKEFPDLGIKTVKKSGKEQLLFDPKNKWALLRLLDDDYLGSELSGEKYEVTGKRRYQA